MEDVRKRSPTLILEQFIRKALIQKVYTELGISLSSANENLEVEKELEEEIDEEDGYI